MSKYRWPGEREVEPIKITSLQYKGARSRKLYADEASIGFMFLTTIALTTFVAAKLLGCSWCWAALIPFMVGSIGWVRHSSVSKFELNVLRKWEAENDEE